jgi:hypothetical protein
LTRHSWSHRSECLRDATRLVRYPAMSRTTGDQAGGERPDKDRLAEQLINDARAYRR